MNQEGFLPVCFLEMRETLDLLAIRTNQWKDRVKAEKGDQIDEAESMGRVEFTA